MLRRLAGLFHTQSIALHEQRTLSSAALVYVCTTAVAPDQTLELTAHTRYSLLHTNPTAEDPYLQARA
jgi:hypothetical protein